MKHDTSRRTGGDWLRLRSLDDLPALPQTVRGARDFATEVLADLASDDAVDDVTLALSEVVTNAVLHAGTTIKVSVAVGREVVRVEVADGSPRVPSARDYASTAGTGRGLRLVAALTARWGVDVRSGGKSVWFEVSLSPDPATVAVSPGGSGADHRSGSGREQDIDEDPLDIDLWLQGLDAEQMFLAAGERPSSTGEIDPAVRPSAPVGGQDPAGAPIEWVELLEVPVLLYWAWREHADALLRELLLVELKPGAEAEAVIEHAAASDAMELLDAAVPSVPSTATPGEAMAAAEGPGGTAHVVRVHVPLGASSHFDSLDVALEGAARMAEARVLLTAPIAPELRRLRHWLCTQVLTQLSGGEGAAWDPDSVAPYGSGPEVVWDERAVTRSPDAVVAADDGGRIIAASPAALELLAYADSSELVGRRLIVLIPERFRQAHIAGLTRHLLSGNGALLGDTVAVPAVRADGQEIPVELTLVEERVAGGRSVFLGHLVPGE